MIFARPSLAVASAVLGFGLLLLVATLATRHQRPHPLLHKGLWLALAAGALGYSIGGIAFTATLYATAGINYAVARSIERAVDRRERTAARVWLGAGVAINVAVLAWLKLGPVFTYSAGAVAAGARSGFWGTRTLLPVGLSFFTFHAVSYLADAYRGRSTTKSGVVSGGVQSAIYLLLLPQFLAGPVSHHTLSGQLSRRAVGMSDFAYGMRRLIIGIGKRLLIAGPCAVAANTILAWRAWELSASAAWLAVTCLTIQIYFTFSAYADMALGLGRLFGFRGEENFKWPYAADSISEFWRRWHIGLTSWFREYLGTDALGPLIGEVIVVLLCAAWYGTAWGCLAWGAYHVVFLVLERRGVIPIARFPWLVRHAYLVLVVGVGWIFLRAATPADALRVLRTMIGVDVPERARALPLSLDLVVALVAGAIGSAPVARALRRWSVAIDAATTSLLMMLFATGLFLWRAVAMVLPRKSRAVPRA